MKKSYLLLGMLMLAFMGCSNSDEETGNKEMIPDTPFDYGEIQASQEMPDSELTFFMTNALYNEDGRRTFFNENVSYEDKCHIINSKEEFLEAYKGNEELPTVDFSQYTLVVGRTYGEDGRFSLNDFELIDNGDIYQFNVTLNRNVNPILNYNCAFVDIFFWRLYPKMENKPVSINRIKKEAIIDYEGNESVNARLRSRWILQGYTDAEGTYHQMGNGWGDDRFTIKFSKNYIVEGQNNRNSYESRYMLIYSSKREGYGGFIDYGVIHLSVMVTTEVNDNDPVAKIFPRIFNATQFELFSTDYLRLRISAKEYFFFRHEALK